MGLLTPNKQFTFNWFQKSARFAEAVNTNYFLLKKIADTPEEERKIYSKKKKNYRVVKLFSLVPERKTALAHIGISISIIKVHLFKCLPNLEKRILKCRMDSSLKPPDNSEIWLDLFQIKTMDQIRALCGVSKKWIFQSCETDGKHICMVFFHPDQEADKAKYIQKLEKLAEIKKRKAAGEDIKGPKSHLFHEGQIPRCTRNLENLHILSKHFLDQVAIISVDPGRNSLMYCYDKTKNSSSELAKKQYNHKNHRNKNKFIHERNMNKTQITFPDQSVVSLRKATSDMPTFKTISTTEFIKALKYRWSIHDQLWKALATHKRNSLKYTTQILSRKTLDEFVHGLTKDYKNTNTPFFVAFGDAKFSGNSRGEISGPTKKLLEAVERQAPVVLVNEYFTSQKCYECVKNCPDDGCVHAKLKHPKREKLLKETRKEKITRIENNLPYTKKFGRRKLHNVVWCETKGHNFMKRDLNSAKSISLIAQKTLLTGNRPPSFVEPSEEAVKIEKTLSPRKRSKKEIA
jgi:hypothetical protein